MKKVISLLLIAVTALAFAGCGKEKIDAGSSEEIIPDEPVAKLVGEWKLPVNEEKNVYLYLSFDADGNYNRYVDFGGERILLNGGSYSYVSEETVFNSGTVRGIDNAIIKIYDNAPSEYYPGIANRTEAAGYWLTSTKSDMMLSDGIEAADVIISEKLDQDGIDSLKAGDIITFSLIDDKVDGTLMANTHTISKVYDNGGSKEFLIEYPYEFYGKKSDKVSADRVLGKYVGSVHYENNKNLGEYFYEIKDGELKFWRVTYESLNYAYERG